MEKIFDGALGQIGAYLVIFLVIVIVFFFRWVTKRIQLLVLCQLAVMDGMKELGVNGSVKKRFEELQEQIAKD